jgi:hypothetical protein
MSAFPPLLDVKRTSVAQPHNEDSSRRATNAPDAPAIPVITYFAVLPFGRTEDGDLLAEAAIEVRRAAQARAMAARMEGPERGAVAFSKTGDPQLGEWDDAVILGRYGDVPDDLAPDTSD